MRKRPDFRVQGQLEGTGYITWSWTAPLEKLVSMISSRGAVDAERHEADKAAAVSRMIRLVV